MKFYLIVAKGPKQGMPIHVAVDLFLLGSEPMCQLRAPTLAPKHCAIVVRDRKVFIRDFNGGKPTIVNGEDVPAGEEWPLHAGDRITVGPLEFMIQFHEKSLSQRDLEEWAASCLDHGAHRDLLAEIDHQEEAHNAQEAAAQIIDHLNLVKGVIKGRLRVAREAGTMVIRFNDTKIVEEAEIAHLKHELCATLDKPNLRIILDFKNVRRLSSNGVVMLREFCHWVAPKGSRVAFCRIRDEIRTAMTTLHTDDVPVFGDRHEALAAKW
jgi:anti-anti-sigma regulatory factor